MNPPPAPTFPDLPYGPHERQRLDVWLPRHQRTPAAALVYFHGGGWRTGDKGNIHDKPLDLGRLLAAGVAVVSANYRFVPQAHADGLKPPVRGPLEDSARAVQFVRSQAASWNLDPSRVAGGGASAGGCTALWLAFHADLADPESPDPVKRESTRFACAAVFNAQTTLDPVVMREWLPNITYGPHAFGIGMDEAERSGNDRFAEFLARRAELADWIAEYSPATHLRGDAPPVYLQYRPPAGGALRKGQPEDDPVHSPLLGAYLVERAAEVGADVLLHWPEKPDAPVPNATEFLLRHLAR